MEVFVPKPCFVPFAFFVSPALGAALDAAVAGRAALTRDPANSPTCRTLSGLFGPRIIGPDLASVTIPNRPVFRAQEVCELAEVQPYVLRSWEAEFPDLGVAKTANGPRVYRRGDVERVLRLKHLLFVDGLTLAGARRQLAQEGAAPAEDEVTDADVAAMLDQQAKQNLRDVRRGLQWILGVLNGEGATAEDFVLVAAPADGARTARPAKGRPAAHAKPSKPALAKPKKALAKKKR
jgi:DNA-binding transcriptional MerR regulator